MLCGLNRYNEVDSRLEQFRNSHNLSEQHKQINYQLNTLGSGHWAVVSLLTKLKNGDKGFLINDNFFRTCFLRPLDPETEQ